MGLIQYAKNQYKIKELKAELEVSKLSAASNFAKAMNYGYSNNGASKTKNSLKSWSSQSGSPQQDIDKNLDTLRQLSLIHI